MSILLTADIHGNSDWLNYLRNRAGDFSSVLIAGDVLSFNDDSLPERAKASVFAKFAHSMERSGLSLGFTSGNQDLDDLELLDGNVSGDLEISDREWMRFPAENELEHVFSYDSIRDLGELILLSLQWCPWTQDGGLAGDYARALCLEATIRSFREKKPLAFLYHEPPHCSPFIASLLEEFDPAFLFCGHEHEAPFEAGPITKFRSCETEIINCGQRGTYSAPVAGQLDLGKNEFRWFREGLDFPPQIFSID